MRYTVPRHFCHDPEATRYLGSEQYEGWTVVVSGLCAEQRRSGHAAGGPWEASAVEIAGLPTAEEGTGPLTTRHSRGR